VSLREITSIGSGDCYPTNRQRGRAHISQCHSFRRAGHTDGNRTKAQTGWRKLRRGADAAERHLLRAACSIVRDAQGCAARTARSRLKGHTDRAARTGS